MYNPGIGAAMYRIYISYHLVVPEPASDLPDFYYETFGLDAHGKHNAFMMAAHEVGKIQGKGGKVDTISIKRVTSKGKLTDEEIHHPDDELWWLY